jgi:hypothetical protein
MKGGVRETFNIQHSTLNIEHSMRRAASLFVALIILFASSLSA